VLKKRTPCAILNGLEMASEVTNDDYDGKMGSTLQKSSKINIGIKTAYRKHYMARLVHQKQ
jgi:hypothetical protein